MKPRRLVSATTLSINWSRSRVMSPHPDPLPQAGEGYLSPHPDPLPRAGEGYLSPHPDPLPQAGEGYLSPHPDPLPARERDTWSAGTVATSNAGRGDARAAS